MILLAHSLKARHWGRWMILGLQCRNARFDLGFDLRLKEKNGGHSCCCRFFGLNLKPVLAVSTKLNVKTQISALLWTDIYWAPPVVFIQSSRRWSLCEIKWWSPYWPIIQRQIFSREMHVSNCRRDSIKPSGGLCMRELGLQYRNLPNSTLLSVWWCHCQCFPGIGCYIVE